MLLDFNCSFRPRAGNHTKTARVLSASAVHALFIISALRQIPGVFGTKRTMCRIQNTGDAFLWHFGFRGTVRQTLWNARYALPLCFRCSPLLHIVQFWTFFDPNGDTMYSGCALGGGGLVEETLWNHCRRSFGLQRVRSTTAASVTSIFPSYSFEKQFTSENMTHRRMTLHEVQKTLDIDVWRYTSPICVSPEWIPLWGLHCPTIPARS